MTSTDLQALKEDLKAAALGEGFSDMRVGTVETSPYFEQYQQWIKEQNHGDMGYLANNTELRQNPDQLHPGTLRVLSFRYPYLPQQAQLSKPLASTDLANISRYALGRDYHKFLRKKLQRIAQKFQLANNFDFRVFVDSAPVLETAFAEKSGLGWKGKHTLLISADEGSWFFLAEIFTNLTLPVDKPVENQCGQCSACMSICPTNAIVEPYKLDARRCISYLTIEHHGSIDESLRPLIGNHIYGCDDCQAICPWNRFALSNRKDDFKARHQLDSIALMELWAWTEQEFLDNFAGSPIRRIGYQKWLRNLAIAIGNSESSAEKIKALRDKSPDAEAMALEHINWAINQLQGPSTTHDKQVRDESWLKTKKLESAIKKMTPELS